MQPSLLPFPVSQFRACLLNLFNLIHQNESEFKQIKPGLKNETGNIPQGGKERNN